MDKIVNFAKSLKTINIIYILVFLVVFVYIISTFIFKSNKHSSKKNTETVSDELRQCISNILSKQKINLS